MPGLPAGRAAHEKRPNAAKKRGLRGKARPIPPRMCVASSTRSHRAKGKALRPVESSAPQAARTVCAARSAVGLSALGSLPASTDMLPETKASLTQAKTVKCAGSNASAEQGSWVWPRGVRRPQARQTSERDAVGRRKVTAASRLARTSKGFPSCCSRSPRSVHPTTGASTSGKANSCP